MTKWLTRKRCWAVLEGFNECQLVERSDGDIIIDSRNQVGPTNPTVSRDGALLFEASLIQAYATTLLVA